MTSNQSRDTEPGARARVITLGLDIHASLIVVVRQVDEQASQPPQRFSEEAFIGFVHRQLAAAESVHSCYEAGPFGNWYDILNRMTTDNLAKQLSCSWYQPGAGADPVARALDEWDDPNVSGTIAGEDTVFVATPGIVEATALCRRLTDILSPSRAPRPSPAPAASRSLRERTA